MNAPSPDLDGGTPDAASDHADSDAEADENAESDSAKVLDSNILNAFSELAITDCKTNLGDGLGEADVCDLLFLNATLADWLKRSS